jgi:hypothetical protein
VSVLGWLDGFRDADRDRREALEATRERALRMERQALADYDRFVRPALRAAEGLFMGTARSSAGEEVPIRLPWGSELVHQVWCGGTGTGKTTGVAGTLVAPELAARRGVGVIDFKGDLFRQAIERAAAHAITLPAAERERLRQRLVVLNPFGDYLVPLNVCRPMPGCSIETQAFEVTLAISRCFDSALGHHMEAILRHLVVLLANAGLTLLEAPRVLRDNILRTVLVRRSQDVGLEEFFLRAYETIPKVSKDALLSRLEGLLFSEPLRLALGADDLVDFQSVLDRSDPLFAFLGKGPDVSEEQVEVVGSLVVQLLLQATYARGTGAARPRLLILDEFFHLLTAPGMARRFETALATARSFGLSLVFVFHNAAQLSPALREILLGNADLVMVFRTTARNASLFGDFLPDADPDVQRRFRSKSVRPSRDEVRTMRLEALQRLPDRTCFLYDRRKPHRAVRLRLADIPLPHEAAGLPRERFDEFLREGGWDRGGAAVSRAELRRQIEARRQRLDGLLRPIATVPRKSNMAGASRAIGTTTRRRPRLG